MQDALPLRRNGSFILQMRGRRVSQAVVGVASFRGGEADGEAKQEHAKQLHREWEWWFGRLFAFD